MQAKEIMTRSPMCGSAGDSMKKVAQMMRDQDCGCVPIVDEESGSLLGIVTDRDLTVRGLASGKSPDTRVGDLMTPNPICCGQDDDMRDIERKMANNQIRRVPIVDSARRCLGIISQADLARAAAAAEGKGARLTDREVAIVVERISEPGHQRYDRGVSQELEQPF
jgi:CBS domain-containing protein